ncbi:hypothetical protein BH09GEM1_BH09GEM1_23260 [soil metagenome]
MRVWKSVSIAHAVLLVSGASASAQGTAHDMSAMARDTAAPMRSHLSVQAIPLVTRADPTAGGAAASQAVVSQLVAMLRSSFGDGHGTLAASLDAEGLTMPNGELNTGGYGEGFVDRRHPHTYIHELMLTGRGSSGPVSWSVTAGRGFAPFGTDDPMMRPIAKFPINHHLAQILERAGAIGAVRVGPVVIEGGTFGGDEPTHPSSLPRASRIGDSWSARATVVPVSGVELQASHARVASPEEASGIGLDQRKQSISGRAISGNGRRYFLMEWARTVERDAVRQNDVFGYESALAEGAVQIGSMGVALRVEQSGRPEEDRLAEAFRTPRPSTDLSINGLTQWRTATLHIAAPALRHGGFAGTPFLEGALLSAEPSSPQSVFTPERLYGRSHFTMLTAGIRVIVGGAHSRMGRYGVADVGGPPFAGMAGGSGSHQH